MSCRFARNAQLEMLDVLAEATSREGFAARVPRVIEIACAYADALKSGAVRYQDLVIRKRLSKEPDDYVQNSLTAIVAKELAGTGVELSAGESVQYVIVDQKADVPCDRARAFVNYDGQEPYDVAKYTELLLRAVETLLAPVGIKRSRIDEWVKDGMGKTNLARLPEPREMSWGPLFEHAAKVARVF